MRRTLAVALLKVDLPKQGQNLASIHTRSYLWLQSDTGLRQQRDQ